MCNNGFMKEDIRVYHNKQTDADKLICEQLYEIIEASLPQAESKVWHAHPVWFLEGNPIVGYSKLKDSVRLMFWSGQSFNEPDLSPEGTFKAAEVRYTNADQINPDELKRYLQKAALIQWDYKNIIKNKGMLTRLQTDGKD